MVDIQRIVTVHLRAPVGHINQIQVRFTRLHTHNFVFFFFYTYKGCATEEYMRVFLNCFSKVVASPNENLENGQRNKQKKL
jgi:hypothetical protein